MKLDGHHWIEVNQPQCKELLATSGPPGFYVTPFVKGYSRLDWFLRLFIYFFFSFVFVRLYLTPLHPPIPQSALVSNGHLTGDTNLPAKVLNNTMDQLPAAVESPIISPPPTATTRSDVTTSPGFIGRFVFSNQISLLTLIHFIRIFSTARWLLKNRPDRDVYSPPSCNWEELESHIILWREVEPDRQNLKDVSRKDAGRSYWLANWLTTWWFLFLKAIHWNFLCLILFGFRNFEGFLLTFYCEPLSGSMRF